MNTKRLINTTLRVGRLATSYFLAMSALLVAVPTSTTAQRSDLANKQGDNAVRLATIINAKSDKMSGVASYAEMRTAAAKDRNGGVAVRSAAQTATKYNVLNVEFKTPAARRLVFPDSKASKLAGAYVLTVTDRFADIFVDRSAPWEALLKNVAVLKVEYSTTVEAPPPPEAAPAKLTSAAVPESIVRGGYRGMTGKNVIIAILDTGVDFRHPDFITYDAAGVPTSRIAYLWDTATPFQKGRGSVAPVSFPNGASIGTLYNQAQLTAELRATTKTFPATDLDGHGTACASVAAGNGNADKAIAGLKRPEVIGAAPEATIIGIRMGYEGLENSYLLNTFAAWLETIAGTRPLVISGSFGGNYTGHDGQRVEERQLNARFPLNRAGRAIVFAAGNDGHAAIHSKVNFASTPVTVSWNAKQKTYVRVFFDSVDTGLAMLPTALTPLGPNLTVEKNPITNQFEAKILVNAGPGSVQFQNANGKMSEAHMYFASPASGIFAAENAVYSHLVGTPGAAENAITVGSFDWNDNFNYQGKLVNLNSVCRDAKGVIMPIEIGWLSCYSSPGPSRSGGMKPDIVAPGEWYQSANAKMDGKSVGDPLLDTTGNYRAMNGTSAATPYTSGIIALIFQKKPTLTLGELKTLLKSKASKTGLTPKGQSVPNGNWGYGKLDNAAIGRIFDAL